MNTIIEQFRTQLLDIALYEDQTVANYVSCLYKYLDFIKLQFKIDYVKTTPQHLKQWMIHLKKTAISNSRLTHHRSALVNFFTFLVSLNIITKNPTDGLFPIRRSKSSLNQPIDENTAFTLLKSMDKTTWIGERNFMIVSCLWALGLRRRELTKLKIRDFDSNYDPQNKIGLLIIHGKDRKQRALFVVGRLYENLTNYLAHPKSPKQKHNPIFPNKNDGKKISGDQILKIVRQAAQKAGIEQRVTPHVLRHSFATEMYLQEVPLNDIEDIMGHENEAETAIYIHVPEELKKQALEIISLDSEYSWPFLYGGKSRL